MNKELFEQLEKNQPKYHEKAWQNYTDEELSWWVKLLTKRAEHRIDQTKKEKDLRDARNYQLMLESRK